MALTSIGGHNCSLQKKGINRCRLNEQKHALVSDRVDSNTLMAGNLTDECLAGYDRLRIAVAFWIMKLKDNNMQIRHGLERAMLSLWGLACHNFFLIPLFIESSVNRNR